jgi:hypothetical protein
MPLDSLFASITIRLALYESKRSLVKVRTETATVYFETVMQAEAWEGVES